MMHDDGLMVLFSFAALCSPTLCPIRVCVYVCVLEGVQPTQRHLRTQTDSRGPAAVRRRLTELENSPPNI